MFIACDRKAESAFGGRCRNEATFEGRCEKVFSHKNGSAPRADKPTIPLVKFRLPNHLFTEARDLFPEMIRNEDHEIKFEESHRILAQLAGRKFKGIRIEEGPGDSGTQIFGKEGLPFPLATGIPEEIAHAGFRLDNVHCFQRQDARAFLVLGYKKVPRDVRLTTEQQAFLKKKVFAALWGVCHAWANIPEHIGTLKGNLCKFVVIKEGSDVVVFVTNPKDLPEPMFTLPISEVQIQEWEVIHTLNFTGYDFSYLKTLQQKKTVPPRPANRLVYNDGLWGITP